MALVNGPVLKPFILLGILVTVVVLTFACGSQTKATPILTAEPISRINPYASPYSGAYCHAYAQTVSHADSHTNSYPNPRSTADAHSYACARGIHSGPNFHSRLAIGSIHSDASR